MHAWNLKTTWPLHSFHAFKKRLMLLSNNKGICARPTHMRTPADHGPRANPATRGARGFEANRAKGVAHEGRGESTVNAATGPAATPRLA
eukprot:3292116-Pyramimonas_sp.AAC.1